MLGRFLQGEHIIFQQRKLGTKITVVQKVAVRAAVRRVIIMVRGMMIIGNVPFITFQLAVFIFHLVEAGLFLKKDKREGVKCLLFFVLNAREVVLIEFIIPMCPIHHLRL